jgi:chaperonin cofactor prefoldin
MQLELFPKQYDSEIEDLKERYERLRKSQHARITGLQKEIKEIKTELEFLKANICKGLLL